jgi:23S rRNA (adenine2503-C2)-methyltransferase
MLDIKDYTLKELADEFISLGAKSFHAKQAWSWMYKKGVLDFGLMSDLPKVLKLKLGDKFYILGLNALKEFKSADGTQKLLLKARDGNCFEAVVIPAQDRVTGCVSSQAGCKFSCSFCASGVLGFKRNLGAGEIIEEVLFLKSAAPGNCLTHLVFMGTGEPLDNYANLIKAIRVINAREGLNIGARRITISTCGIIPGIEQLSREGLQVELSVSLHAAEDKLRSKIMPVNKKYPLAQLLSACREYSGKTNRQVTFEYTLIKGLNSSLKDAANLAGLLAGFKLSKVNLIPANAVKELKIEPADEASVAAFKGLLKKRGVNVTLRRERGSDINAACGQLRLNYAKA